MNAPQSKLFSPYTLNGHTLKNRIGVAPMTRMSAGPEGIPRQDVLDFLVRRAQNGVSLIYSEAIIIDTESAQGYPGQARLLTPAQIDAWKPVTAAIRAAGAVSIMQMFHCGRVSWLDVNPAKRVIAPSAIAGRSLNPLTQAPYPVPEAMNEKDIAHAIQGFVRTAQGAIAAGFDGIEVHGAHGYLISQFLSPYSNQRTDGYGGSTEGRYRFAHEVIQAVRAVVPKNKILTFRISNWGMPDLDVSLFGTQAEYQAVVRLLAQEPIDALSLSTYNFADKAFGTDQTMAQLTRAVCPLPLLLCGGIYDRATAESASDQADIVLSGKSLLLNPNWVADITARKPLTPYRGEQANIAYGPTPLM
jgi:2,4-dienoyl-CoA reductase-like NADH-dependent reductase (Old Yellow Enzyme family)